ncbi:MAG: AMP-binding protein, partial [Bacteroidota bacterium]
MDTTLQRDRYAPSDTYRGQSHVQSLADYEALYRRSIEDNEAFWAEQAERVTWFKPFETVKNVSFASDNVSIAWYEGGQLNASFNCLDRHLEERGTQTALIFEPDNPEEEARHITYQDLYHEVCRFANILLKHGVQKGDRVTIYMPMIPEVAAAMLACSRIGAMHSVVFAGFSPDSLAKRMLDCESTVLLTADGGFRGGRVVRLKENVDKALEQCPDVTTVVVTRRTGTDIHMEPGRDVWYHEERETVA